MSLYDQVISEPTSEKHSYRHLRLVVARHCLQHVGRDTQTSARMREIRSPGLQRQFGLSVDVRTEILDSPVLVDA
ncbi:hypothetical protein ASE61_18250 [Bosea sp. Root670]|nr:hypothetical protein ASE61_18250 [Bosea sp. Root670]